MAPRVYTSETLWVVIQLLQDEHHVKLLSENEKQVTDLDLQIKLKSISISLVDYLKRREIGLLTEQNSKLYGLFELKLGLYIDKSHPMGLEGLCPTMTFLRLELTMSL